MQSYELFAENLKGAQKAVKDAAGAIARLQKSIQKNTDTGNLAEARKGTAALMEAIGQIQTLAEQLKNEMDAFDVQEYFVSGDFTVQLLNECREKKVDVKGEKGVYEMFPYKIRVLGDQEHPAEVWMDRKKVQSCRPAYVAEMIRSGQSKLYSAKFNAATFMNELGEAYEITCLRAGARLGSTQALTKIYKNLALMSRSRKEYDMQAFAFDLARVYEAGPESWTAPKTGACYDFGTSRDGSSGIRVLSRTGVESFISTLNLKNTVKE